MEKDLERDRECCGQFFLAELAEQPGELLLECCLCGRPWLRKRDGTMVARRNLALEKVGD